MFWRRDAIHVGTVRQAEDLSLWNQTRLHLNPNYHRLAVVLGRLPHHLTLSFLIYKIGDKNSSQLLGYVRRIGCGEAKKTVISA